MRRITTTTIIAALACAAPAAAHVPGLSLHRARIAATHYVQRDVRNGEATTGRVTTCTRSGARRVRCGYTEDGVVFNGVNDGSPGTWTSYVTVTRHGSCLTIDPALFTNAFTEPVNR